ncbi:MAG: tripartite tricarboxylate transporter substrate binding protein [Betaproteobacteria bacterium]|nr:tripartite tricarboxylate transporter substrate binding protein [Betaproteobacteria bacterium]
MHRYVRFAVAGLAGLLCAAAAPSLAQGYPNKPIRFIVPFPAGGGSDYVARAVGRQLGAALGQSVVVDNRSGASGIIGAEAAARSAPDGYTALIGDAGTLAINPGLYRKLPFDTLKDFQAVSMLVISPHLLVVNPSLLPVADLRELIARAKASPGKINYASYGAGSITHLIAELFTRQSGVQLVHVPYKGAAPALQAVVGGQVGMTFLTFGLVKGQIDAGALRVIATSSRERLAALPNVTSIHEAGIQNFDASGWISCMVPAGTPKEIVARLNEEIGKVIMSPDIQKQWNDRGYLSMPGSPEQYTQFVKRELDKWGGVTKALGITLD